MYLTFLGIPEFKGLPARSILFSPGCNVVIGGNSSGKTGVLDSAVVAMTWLTGGSAPPDTRVTATIETPGAEYSWPEDSQALAARLNGGGAPRPIFAYYRGGEDVSHDAPPDAAHEAVERALSATVFAPDPVKLEVSAGGWSVRVDREPPRSLLEYGAGTRRIVAIASDLAMRCCAANPGLGASASAETPGVVLIDDIETHLHPNWQRRVLEDLRNGFPAVQWIAATHSPFIVQSVHDGKIVDLDGRDTAEAPNLSIEDIAESMMGVRIPQRSKRYLDMNAAAQEAAVLIRSADSASEEQKREIRARLDALSMPFSNNQAFHAFLAMERIEAGLMEEDE